MAKICFFKWNQVTFLHFVTALSPRNQGYFSDGPEPFYDEQTLKLHFPVLFTVQ